MPGPLRDRVATALATDARLGTKGRNWHGIGYEASVAEDHPTERVLRSPSPTQTYG